jgi:starch-binding outer membrane protein, SusD/RagB family
MKTKLKMNKVLLSGILAIGLLGSCSKDFLDQKPYTQITPEDALATESDMLAALRGTYATLRAANLFGRNIQVIGDLSADNVFISTKNSGRFFAWDQYVFTSANTEYTGMWTDSYTAILRANNIINASVAGSAAVNQYKGEAYAIRALMYFNLVRTYARPYTDNPAGPGVPIVTQYDPKLKPARSSVADVYALIQADLLQAYNLMTQYTGSNRFSKYAARALAAKASLYQGLNQQAYDFANDVITNGGFTLATSANLGSYWSNVAGNPATSKLETLFEVSADATLNVGTDELAYMYLQAGYGDLLVNPTLYNLYNATDVRRSLITVGSRAGGEAVAYIVNKYKSVSGDRDDKKVLRLSEVYLIASEASARIGLATEPRALTLLNTLMAQRDPSLVYASTGAQLINDIVQERRKELAFEGDRSYDLTRLKRDITRVGGTYSITSIPYTNDFRLAPIPQAERDVNPITQNPGYIQ